jgi:hypothetical protein
VFFLAAVVIGYREKAGSKLSSYFKKFQVFNVFLM